MTSPWLANRLNHPAQMIVGGFATTIGLGTGLLSLPVATADGRGAPTMDAVFTATSAVCVTGLVTVDTGEYWSAFGQAVILGLIQIGGLGIMTLATLVTVLVAGRLGLRGRSLAQAETKSPVPQDMSRAIRRIVLFSLIAEFLTAVALTARFLLEYHQSSGRAVYLGVFHAVSAFNNAGFSPHSDSLTRYVTDPWVCLPVAGAVIVGGLGFPVVFELARSWRRPSRWSVMTRLTVWLTLGLILVGTMAFTLSERSNPATLGALDGGTALMGGFFHSVMTRTAGFNTVDVSAMRPETLFITDAFMFVGGGSAGTAGGIKVTTFGLLGFVVWSEMRGERHVHVGRRRVPESNQRQALAVALVGIGMVGVSTMVMLGLTGHGLDRDLFEVVSAFGTVGLSAGLTTDLPTSADALLIGLMFAGRVGPLTVASALALRDRGRRFALPEERTIVG